MEANCFSLFSIIFCIGDLTLASVIRDLGLIQSWNFGIQRFLVSRYFGCTGQSWADPEQVFKGLPGKQRHSHFLHPCFWFFQCYLQSLEIYLSSSFQKYRVSTEQYSCCEILIHQNPACIIRTSALSVVVHLHFGRAPEDADHRPIAPGMNSRGILCTNKAELYFPTPLTHTGYLICCQNLPNDWLAIPCVCRAWLKYSGPVLWLAPLLSCLKLIKGVCLPLLPLLTNPWAEAITLWQILPTTNSSTFLPCHTNLTSGVVRQQQWLSSFLCPRSSACLDGEAIGRRKKKQDIKSKKCLQQAALQFLQVDSSCSYKNDFWS